MYYIAANIRIKTQFRDRRWMNLLPEHLNYQFTQLLFVGERPTIQGEEVVDELEKLEQEDEARVNHLKGSFYLALIKSLGDDAVFKDLELSKRDFLPGALHGELE
jgi:hypothetical protein